MEMRENILGKFVKNASIKEIKFDVKDLQIHDYYRYNIAPPSSFEKMVPKRRSEYLAGRVCAVNAMSEVSHSQHHQVESDKQSRAPRWPEGLVGSISHSSNHAIACVAKKQHYISIGIDVETIFDSKAAKALADQILTNKERSLNHNMKFNDLTTLAFSAKEAAYKAIYNDAKFVFGFNAMALISSTPTTFKLEVQQNLSPKWKLGSTITGEYRITENKIYSLILITQPNTRN